MSCLSTSQGADHGLRVNDPVKLLGADVAEARAASRRVLPVSAAWWAIALALS